LGEKTKQNQPMDNTYSFNQKKVSLKNNKNNRFHFKNCLLNVSITISRDWWTSIKSE